MTTPKPLDLSGVETIRQLDERLDAFLRETRGELYTIVMSQNSDNSGLGGPTMMYILLCKDAYENLLQFGEDSPMLAERLCKLIEIAREAINSMEN